MSAVREAAIVSHKAGLCVVPPAEDGSKAPLGPRQTWGHFQKRRPTPAELDGWYTRGNRSGIGYVLGAVSGNRECLEFDCPETWQAFRDTAEACGLDAVVARIVAGYCDATPGGGVHLLYQCDEIGGNTKLARRPKRPEEMAGEHDTVKVKIETRGEGGYAVSAPSNGRVHPSGKPYVRLSGGVDTIATITPEERADLFALARAFDVMPRADHRASEASASADGARPGDDYNRRVAWSDVLEPFGWVRVYHRGDEEYWRRPGKDRGVSATTNYAESGLLYVFTSSTAFEPECSYTPFGAYAVLNHDGDYRAAARDLRSRGYGATSGNQADAKYQAHDRSQRTDNTDKTGSGSFGSASDEQKTGEIWSERQPLPVEMPSVPTLPDALIPSALRPWLVDAAQRTTLPLEMVAAPAIVAAGAVVGRNCGIRPGRFDDFLTVPNLWGAVVARPGWMKSAAVQEAMRPLGRLIVAARKQYEADSEEFAAQRECIEAEIDGIKARMRKAAAKGEDLATFKEELLAKRRELKEATATERRYVTHDATVEKLGELLKENPRGLMVERDELSGWLRSLDKAGREGDREFFLEAWNGTGNYTVDRIGRGTVHIPSLTLSVFGGIQPGKLRPLISGALDGEEGDDGLVQRLQVLVWPDSLPPWERVDRWPDSEARDRAATVFAGLDTLTAYSVDAACDDGGIPYLRFTPQAQAVFDAWRDELERRLRSDELDDAPSFASHLSKYRSLMPSLALIFHLIGVAAGEGPGPVGESSARLGADWCDFLELHARKVYTAELAAGASSTIALANKIEAGAVIDKQPVRELYRAQWAGLRTPERVLSGLTGLSELGWLRMETVESTSVGGRPSQVVRLHPELRQGAAS